MCKKIRTVELTERLETLNHFLEILYILGNSTYIQMVSSYTMKGEA
jgi:hypothetical protein